MRRAVLIAHCAAAHLLTETDHSFQEDAGIMFEKGKDLYSIEGLSLPIELGIPLCLDGRVIELLAIVGLGVIAAHTYLARDFLIDGG